MYTIVHILQGVSIDYDGDNERICTHSLFMPKVESERISVVDGEVLEKVAVVVPAKVPAKIPKNGETGEVPQKSMNRKRCRRQNEEVCWKWTNTGLRRAPGGSV